MTASSVRDALTLLGLQPGASQEEIRVAYKKLALKWHPDKHQQQQQGHPDKQQQQQAGDSAAAFSSVAAAYQLLTAGLTAPGTAACPSTSASDSSSGGGWPPFEAAYAGGSLFSDALVDEAVLASASPADVCALERLAAAAAAGDLPAALSAAPPTAEDEQLWRQLYASLLWRRQLQQALQQHQHQHQQQQQRQSAELLPGVCITQLLSDLLIKPTGPVLLEVSDAEDDQAQETPPHALQQQRQQQQQQQRQQQQQQPGGPPQKRLRRGWGFYWMWLRRLLLAKAVVSLLASRQRGGSWQHHAALGRGGSINPRDFLHVAE